MRQVDAGVAETNPRVSRGQQHDPACFVVARVRHGTRQVLAHHPKRLD